MAGGERLFALCEIACDHPVILGLECKALAFAGDDQCKRGRLDAAGRADVAVAAEFHQRQITREHGAPDKVDLLAGLAGIR